MLIQCRLLTALGTLAKQMLYKRKPKGDLCSVGLSGLRTSRCTSTCTHSEGLSRRGCRCAEQTGTRCPCWVLMVKQPVTL